VVRNLTLSHDRVRRWRENSKVNVRILGCWRNIAITLIGRVLSVIAGLRQLRSWKLLTTYLAQNVGSFKGDAIPTSRSAAHSRQTSPIDATHWTSNGWQPIASGLPALSTLW
jgi:hypothetical protein